MIELQDPPSHPTLRRVYLTGIILAAALFALHTWIIFETAFLLSKLTPDAMAYVGPHVGGPLLILSCFFLLFITHIAEAALWAVFFWKARLLPSFGLSLYFTGTSLTALGYGDVVLHAPWRGLGPIMATNGILMFGCSTAFLFFVIQKVWTLL